MTDTQTEPQKCPACGSEALAYRATSLCWHVVCEDDYCDLSGPFRATEAKAVAAWNRIRYDRDTPLDRVLSALRAACEAHTGLTVHDAVQRATYDGKCGGKASWSDDELASAVSAFGGRKG
jgi:hypothetical protein